MEKLSGKTFNEKEFKLKLLKDNFPEAFTDGKLDVSKLEYLFQNNVETAREKFEFNWNGKNETIKIAQKQTTGTLRPHKETSKKWDTTQNLYLEGDNLEVLRVLQNSYRNKIKFIYIDPPYNTGKDFVYKDDYKDNIKNYIEQNNENMKYNPETNGRFHTNWLNMMYPRLKISRNLLSDNGVIYISIGDVEFANLKKICDEIFGEHNFIATNIWNCSTGGGIRPKFFSVTHEYGLIYAKDITNINQLDAPLSPDALKLYTKEDKNGKYREKDFVFRNDSTNKNQKYFIKCPDGTMVKPKEGYIYRFIKETFDKALSNDEVVFKKSKNSPLVASEGKQAEWNIYIKKYLGEGVAAPNTIVPKELAGLYNTGTRVIQDLFDGKRVFQNPKSVNYLKYLINIFTDKDSLVMDFFSGSATLAHSVMEKNREDDGDRKFIMVQIPEPTSESSDAYKAGFYDLCELGKERINRAGEALLSENKKINLDIGYKVFKIDETNLHKWDYHNYDLEQNLLELIDPLKEGRTQEDVVYEILLKYGVDLTAPIEEKKVLDKRIYDVGMGYLLICLEKELDLYVIEEMAKKKPSRVVFYDEGFKDDTVRTNAQQILKRYSVEDIRVI